MSKPTRLLFQQALTLTGEEYHRGEIRIRDGRIEEIRSEVAPEFDGITLDRSDCLILPGFVNAHCHLSLSALEGTIPKGLPFAGWIEQVIAQNHVLSWPDRVAALRQGARSLLRSGVTALGDYLSHAELLAEYSGLPFRQVLYLETLGFQSEVAEKRAEEVQAVLEAHPATQGARLRLGVAAHSPYSVSPELFQQLRVLAERYSCAYSCHVGEVEGEMEFLQTGQGPFRKLLADREVFDVTWRAPEVHPVEYLDRLGQWPLQAVHLNCWTPKELNLLAERGGSAVFCPGSTRWFNRTQWMPVRELLDRGVPVGLGTDSLASNDSLNFFKELHLAEQMLPGVHREEILKMATIWGAESLGVECGTLEQGKPADLVGLRMGRSGEHWEDLLFDPKRRSVDFLMIGGDAVDLAEE